MGCKPAEQIEALAMGRPLEHFEDEGKARKIVQRVTASFYDHQSH